MKLQVFLVLLFALANRSSTYSDLFRPNFLISCILLLPATTKLWPRLCFYIVSVILSTGGSLAGRTPPPSRETPPARRTPPGKETPPARRPPSKETPQQLNPLARRTPPGQGEPRLSRETPRQGEPPQQGDPPWQGDPPARRPPRQGEPLPSGITVNERPVRILLECILVLFFFFLEKWYFGAFPPVPSQTENHRSAPGSSSNGGGCETHLIDFANFAKLKIFIEIF